MTTPSVRYQALEILTRRGVSPRQACGYLGLVRRVACYELRQPDKDRSAGDRSLPRRKTCHGSATAAWQRGYR